MLKFIYSMFWSEVETNSLCPNSFGPMPSGKFHNFAIEIIPHDDDEDVYIPEGNNAIIDLKMKNKKIKNKKIKNKKIKNKKINITTFVDETSDVYDGKCDV